MSFLLFGSFLLCTCLFLWFRRSTGTIHPAQQQGVEEVRAELAGQAGPVRQRFTDGDCPICLGPTTLACETNCGHVFCSECILSFQRHQGENARVLLCPCCRTPVTLLHESFNDADRAQGIAQTVEELRRFNLVHGTGNRTVAATFWDAPVLLRHLFTSVCSGRGIFVMLQLRVVLSILGTILYVISPFDLVPEAVVGIAGVLDDVLIIVFFLTYLSTAYRRAVLQH